MSSEKGHQLNKGSTRRTGRQVWVSDPHSPIDLCAPSPMRTLRLGHRRHCHRLHHHVKCKPCEHLAPPGRCVELDLWTPQRPAHFRTAPPCHPQGHLANCLANETYDVQQLMPKCEALLTPRFSSEPQLHRESLRCRLLFLWGKKNHPLGHFAHAYTPQTELAVWSNQSIRQGLGLPVKRGSHAQGSRVPHSPTSTIDQASQWLQHTCRQDTTVQRITELTLITGGFRVSFDIGRPKIAETRCAFTCQNTYTVPSEISMHLTASIIFF